LRGPGQVRVCGVPAEPANLGRVVSDGPTTSLLADTALLEAHGPETPC
jgi:hypothetical protein